MRPLQRTLSSHGPPSPTMSSPKSSRSPLGDVSVNAGPMKTREELLAEWKEKRKKERAQQLHDNDAKRVAAAQHAGAKPLASARPTKPRQSLAAHHNASAPPEPACAAKAMARHAYAPHTASKPLRPPTTATAPESATATTTAAVAGTAIMTKQPSEAAANTTTTTAIVTQQPSAEAAAETIETPAGHPRPAQDMDEERGPLSGHSAVATDHTAAAAAPLASSQPTPAAAAPETEPKPAETDADADAGESHEEARDAVANLLQLQLERSIASVPAFRGLASPADEGPDSPQLYSSGAAPHHDLRRSVGTPASAAAAASNTAGKAAALSALAALDAGAHGNQTPSAANAGAGTPYLSRTRGSIGRSSLSKPHGADKRASSGPAGDGATLGAEATPNAAAAASEDDEAAAPMSAEAPSRARAAAMVSTPIPRIRHLRLSDTFVGSPTPPTHGTPMPQHSAGSSDSEGSAMDEDPPEVAVSDPLPFEMQAMLDGSPRPLKRPKRKSMAMHELMETGLNSPGPSPKVDESFDNEDESASEQSVSTPATAHRPRRRMVSAGVQTEDCDWFGILRKLTENASVYECPGDCTARCLCCMLRKITGGDPSPLSFAVLKAKQCSDENDKLRFQNGVLDQQVEEIKKTKAADARHWKELFEQMESSQKQLIKAYHEEVNKCKELEEMVKGLKIEKEELDCEVASLKLQLEFLRFDSSIDD